jgi:hypothetical protein
VRSGLLLDFAGLSKVRRLSAHLGNGLKDCLAMGTQPVPGTGVASADDVRVQPHVGSREELRSLFDLAEDSQVSPATAVGPPAASRGTTDSNAEVEQVIVRAIGEGCVPERPISGMCGWSACSEQRPQLCVW